MHGLQRRLIVNITLSQCGSKAISSVYIARNSQQPIAIAIPIPIANILGYGSIFGAALGLWDFNDKGIISLSLRPRLRQAVVDRPQAEFQLLE
jgi:hypothetical protein